MQSNYTIEPVNSLRLRDLLPAVATSFVAGMLIGVLTCKPWKHGRRNGKNG